MKKRFHNKINNLTERIKKIKKGNKEMEKKYSAKNYEYLKQHQYFVDLQDNYRKLQDILMYKTNLLEKSPEEIAKIENLKPNKKSEKHIYESSVRSLTQMYKFEKKSGQKRIGDIDSKIQKYKEKIKEAEQENQIYIFKMKELTGRLNNNKDNQITIADTISIDDKKQNIQAEKENGIQVPEEKFHSQSEIQEVGPNNNFNDFNVTINRLE